MSYINVPPRSGDPVNDPDSLVKWLDKIEQYLNKTKTASAWVTFDGTAANPITPTGGSITTTITKTGTGDYTVNPGAPTANYGALVTIGNGASGATATLVFAPATDNPTATAFRFGTATTLGVAADSKFITVAFYW